MVMKPVIRAVYFLFFIFTLLFVHLFYPNNLQAELFWKAIAESLEDSDKPNIALGSSTIENFDFSVAPCGLWKNYGIGNIEVSKFIIFAKLLSVSNSAKHVVIYLGENDIANNIPVHEVFNNYNQLLLVLKIIYPNANFHFLGIKLSPARKEKWVEFLKFNELLEKLALESTRYSYHSSSKIDTSDFLSDGVHLNGNGYKKIFHGVFKQC